MLATPVTRRLLLLLLLCALCQGYVWWRSGREKEAREAEAPPSKLDGTGRDGGGGDYAPPAPSDYVVFRDGYELGFNADTHQPDWVAYRLTKEKLAHPNAGRTNDFRPDAEIKESATLADYTRSGYDRGHMAPAADMKGSKREMSQSFLLTNMSPQMPSCNRGVWGRLEDLIRKMAMNEHSIYVVTGPIHDEERKLKTIGKSEVWVPDFYYKVILDETPPRKMIAFIVPNKGSDKELWRFALTVDEVEEATQLDFFPGTEGEDELESGLDLKAWGLKE